MKKKILLKLFWPFWISLAGLVSCEGGTQISDPFVFPKETNIEKSKFFVVYKDGNRFSEKPVSEFSAADLSTYPLPDNERELSIIAEKVFQTRWGYASTQASPLDHQQFDYRFEIKVSSPQLPQKIEFYAYNLEENWTFSYLVDSREIKPLWYRNRREQGAVAAAVIAIPISLILFAALIYVGGRVRKKYLSI